MFSVESHYRTLGRVKGICKEQGRSAGFTHQVCGCPKFTGTKGKVALPETEGESLVIEDCLKRSRDFSREHSQTGVTPIGREGVDEVVSMLFLPPTAVLLGTGASSGEQKRPKSLLSWM